MARAARRARADWAIQARRTATTWRVSGVLTLALDSGGSRVLGRSRSDWR